VKSFAALYDALDRTTSTNKKVAALAAYFAATPPADAAWALFFLTGRKIKRLIPSRVLWELTRDLTGWPEWLLEHCYAAVGDFAEAMALLNDHGDAVVPVDLPLSRWITERVIPLKDMDAGQQREAMRAYWTELDVSQTFVLNRIITGEFRVGASATLAIRALAQVAGVPPATMAHRVMGDWPPTEAFFSEVLAGAPAEAVPSRPYPFFLASPLESPVESLGPREEWLAEWKWDGIRAQIVRRQGAVFLWSPWALLGPVAFVGYISRFQIAPEERVLASMFGSEYSTFNPFGKVCEICGGRYSGPPSMNADVTNNDLVFTTLLLRMQL